MGSPAWWGPCCHSRLQRRYLQRQDINVVADFPGGNLSVFALFLLQIGLLNHVNLEGSRGQVSLSWSPHLIFLLRPQTAPGTRLRTDAHGV